MLDLLTLERSSGALVVPARDEFTPSEVAVIVGMSRQTVVRHIESGDLAAHKIGAHWRVTATDLALFIETQSQRRREASDRVAQATLA